MVAKKQRPVIRLRQMIKKFYGCAECGFFEYPEALDFHHAIKNGEKLLTPVLWSPLRIWEELKKHTIIILCANCHRILTRKGISKEKLTQYELEQKILRPLEMYDSYFENQRKTKTATGFVMARELLLALQVLKPTGWEREGALCEMRKKNKMQKSMRNSENANRYGSHRSKRTD